MLKVNHAHVMQSSHAKITGQACQSDTLPRRQGQRVAQTLLQASSQRILCRGKRLPYHGSTFGLARGRFYVRAAIAIDCLRQSSAIDVHHNAVHKGRLLAGQEGNYSSQFLGLPVVSS